VRGRGEREWGKRESGFLGRGVGVRVYSIGRRITTYLLLHLIGPLVFLEDEAHTYILRHYFKDIFSFSFIVISSICLQMGWFSTQLPKSVHYCFNI
jgi:hypothetical protein